ncbi:hypothetical protein LIER_16676 [Lithospermum erythrorhizon]|uniref:Uncharacterized protein n=1 Tax=Lithospermum erythrorhizon TaxID=34254 RepID=A0AAV3Q8C3_LITER
MRTHCKIAYNVQFLMTYIQNVSLRLPFMSQMTKGMFFLAIYLRNEISDTLYMYGKKKTMVAGPRKHNVLIQAPPFPPRQPIENRTFTTLWRPSFGISGGEIPRVHILMVKKIPENTHARSNSWN